MTIIFNYLILEKSIKPEETLRRLFLQDQRKAFPLTGKQLNDQLASSHVSFVCLHILSTYKLQLLKLHKEHNNLTFSPNIT